MAAVSVAGQPAGASHSAGRGLRPTFPFGCGGYVTGKPVQSAASKRAARLIAYAYIIPHPI